MIIFIETRKNNTIIKIKKILLTKHVQGDKLITVQRKYIICVISSAGRAPDS